MGKNGQINFPNLKGATGIASNDLSDHNPTGSGETRMSDFLITAIGRDQTGGYGTDLRSRGDTSTYPGEIQVGDEFYVVVECLCTNGADTFWLRTVGFKNGSFPIDSTSDIQVLDRQVYSRGNPNVLAFRCEVTGTGTGYLSCTMTDGLNTDCFNYGTQLVWDSSVDPNVSIRGGTPEVESVSFTDNGDGTFNAEALFWDPNDQAESGEILVNVGDRGCERMHTETLATANENGYRTASTDFPNLDSACSQDYQVNLKNASGNILDSASGTFTL
jgi:hypothetical protein